MRTRLLLAALPVLAAGCGGPLFSVGAKAQRVCVRQVGETMPGTSQLQLPPGTQLAGSIQQDVLVDTGDLPDLDDQGVDAKLGLLSFKLTAPGLLGGVQELRVRVEPPAGSPLAPIVLADFPGTQDGAVAHLDGDVLSVDLAALGENLVDYLSAKKLAVHIDAQGSLPANDWQADVELCVNADATFDYGSKL